MRNRWSWGLLMIVGGMLLLLACVFISLRSSRPPMESAAPESKEAGDIFAPPATVAGPAMGMLPTSPSSTSVPSPSAIKVSLTRKLIREAWLTLMVQDVPKVAQQVRQIAEQLGGYVANASQSREPEGEWSAELVLRVPSERYHEALSKLQQLGRVDDLREQVQDVTEEFVDLEARLRNLKRSEQHLLELLKRTGKVSDLLQVERELSERRSEIERIEGRLRYLTHQTTFSTIHVTLKEFRARPMPATAFSIPKVFSDAFRTAMLILRGILIVLIWVVVFGIFWVPLSLFAWWWTKRTRRVEEVAGTSGSK